VEASLRESDPIRAARQKDLEELIAMPFRIAVNKPDEEDGTEV